MAGTAIATTEEENYTVTEDAISSALVALGSGNISQDVFSTFDTADSEQADKVWVALTDSEPVKQNLNKPIEVIGVVVLRVELLNEQTSEIESQPRCVFVDSEGVAYHVTSPVVLRDLRTLIALKGKPTVANPVSIKFVEGGSGTRKFVTLKPGITGKSK